MTSPSLFSSAVPASAGDERFRLKGLDGVRAIAVIFVVLYHLWPTALPGGLIGVDVFFVISGYLITALLLREAAYTGKMHLPQFWMRRLRRLVPAMVLCVVVCASLALLIGGDLLAAMPRQVIAALTYTSNWASASAGNDYFAQTSPELFTNFWSLALEEQFYLAWPVVLVVTCMTVVSWRRRTWVPALLGLGSVLAMALWTTLQHEMTRAYYGLDSHAFGLMIGAVLALLIPWSMYPPRAGVRLPSVEAAYSPGRNILRILLGWASLALLPVLAYRLSEQNAALLAPWGLLAASVLSAGVIQLLLPDVRGMGAEWMRSLLALRPLTWIGRRSYGLYLWHWPLMVLLHYAAPSVPEVARGAAVLILTTGIAALSFRFLEQPVRRLGFMGALRLVGGTMIRPNRSRWAAIGSTALVLAAVAGTVTACLHAPDSTQAESVVADGQKALESKKPSSSASASPSSPETAPAPYKPTPDGRDVTMIGDSVTLASAASLQDKLPGISVDAAVSRDVSQGLDLAQEQQERGQLGRIVVFSLSTNSEMTDQDIDRLTELADKGKMREIVLVTGQAPARLTWVDKSNAAIRRAAEHSENIVVADWKHASDGKPELLVSDGVHPEQQGQDLYAQTVADGVRDAKHRLARRTPDHPESDRTAQPGKNG